MRWPRVVPMLLLSVGAAVAEPQLRYADGRLTARLDQMPLADVLDALARETGAEVSGDVGEPRDVTTAFDDLPIERALDRLLGAQSFTLRYGADGALRSIHLRGLPVAPSVQDAGPAAVQPPDLQRYRVLLTPPLQRALGRTYAPLAVVLATTGQELGPKVRAEAARLLVTAIESDPELRSALVGMKDDALLALLQARAGSRTTELLGTVMGQARSFELRAKAARMLQAQREASVAAAHAD